MASIAILSLIDDIRPSVASAIPNETFVWAIRKTAREFCEKTKWLRETRVYDVVAGTRYYVIAPEEMDETEIIGAKAVELGSTPLTPSSFEEHHQADGYATSWIWQPPNEVWPTPTPTKDTANGLAVRMILQPIATAATLPEYLLRNNRETITEGSMKHILGMRKTAWHDPAGAAEAAQVFMRRVFAARSDADASHRPRAFRTISAWRK